MSTAHGGPVRMYVAPMYGYKSCKWLDAVERVTAGAQAWVLGGPEHDASTVGSANPMAATTSPRADVGRLVRFDAVERATWVDASFSP